MGTPAKILEWCRVMVPKKKTYVEIPKPFK